MNIAGLIVGYLKDNKDGNNSDIVATYIKYYKYRLILSSLLFLVISRGSDNVPDKKSIGIILLLFN